MPKYEYDDDIDPEVLAQVDKEREQRASERGEFFAVKAGERAVLKFLPVKVGNTKKPYAKMAKHWVGKRPIICPAKTGEELGGSPEFDCPVCAAVEKRKSSAAGARVQYLYAVLVLSHSRREGRVKMTREQKATPRLFALNAIAHDELWAIQRDAAADERGSVFAKRGCVLIQARRSTRKNAGIDVFESSVVDSISCIDADDYDAEFAKIMKAAGKIFPTADMPTKSKLREAADKVLDGEGDEDDRPSRRRRDDDEDEDESPRRSRSRSRDEDDDDDEDDRPSRSASRARRNEEDDEDDEDDAPRSRAKSKPSRAHDEDDEDNEDDEDDEDESPARSRNGRHHKDEDEDDDEEEVAPKKSRKSEEDEDEEEDEDRSPPKANKWGRSGRLTAAEDAEEDEEAVSEEEEDEESTPRKAPSGPRKVSTPPARRGGGDSDDDEDNLPEDDKDPVPPKKLNRVVDDEEEEDDLPPPTSRKKKGAPDEDDAPPKVSSEVRKSRVTDRVRKNLENMDDRE